MVQRSKERNRERERRKRKRRKYGQAKLKHAKRGVFSCILAGTSCLTLAILLAIAYVSSGKAAPVIGGFGMVAVVLAGSALYIGIRGFREREKDYITCKIGVGCSALLILTFILIFCRGLF